MRRDGGDQRNKELLPPVAKFVLISLLEECNAKNMMAAISHVQPDALWRRRGFASVTVDITRNVAVTAFCSLLLAPCSPPL